MNPISDGYSFESVAELTKQAVEIIESTEMNEVDIMVLPEALLNHQTKTTIPLPSPTTIAFCDNPNAHFVLRNISCAARNVRKYVIINLHVRVKCAYDDQKFCANQDDSTNLYNMAIVFDRNGNVIAK